MSTQDMYGSEVSTSGGGLRGTSPREKPLHPMLEALTSVTDNIID